MNRVSFRLVVRYGICLLGIIIMALGVALTTKANLGTTPISAIPYVASLGFTPSIGFFTAVLNIGLVFAQILILRKKFPKMQYLQIPVSCMFALFIDVWMHFLPDITVLSYGAKLGILCLATVVLALGVFLEVSADVVLMAGEGAVKMLALISRKDFGMLKTGFDVSMVALGALLSLLLFHELRGIGEGTIISAIFVGVFVKLFHTLHCRAVS